MRLIDADNLRYSDLPFTIGQERIVNSWIKLRPTVDATPVVHAIWELKTRLPFCSVYVCSRCGREISIDPNETLIDYPFCHCGAKMNGEV